MVRKDDKTWAQRMTTADRGDTHTQVVRAKGKPSKLKKSSVLAGEKEASLRRI